MTQRFQLLLSTIIVALAQSCSSQTSSLKEYRLTGNERIICNTLHFDTTIIQEIRANNTNKIEPFHYSLSKVIQKDTEIEADPIFLKGLIFSEQNSKSYELVFTLKDSFRK